MLKLFNSILRTSIISLLIASTSISNICYSDEFSSFDLSTEQENTLDENNRFGNFKNQSSYAIGVDFGKALLKVANSWTATYPRENLNYAEMSQGVNDAVMSERPNLSFGELKIFFKALNVLTTKYFKADKNETYFSQDDSLNRVEKNLFLSNYSYMVGFDFAFTSGLIDLIHRAGVDQLNQQLILNAIQDVLKRQVQMSDTEVKTAIMRYQESLPNSVPISENPNPQILTHDTGVILETLVDYSQLNQRRIGLTENTLKSLTNSTPSSDNK